MHTIDIKRIEEALKLAQNKQRKHANGPLSEASIEARSCIDCFTFILENCVKQEQLTAPEQKLLALALFGHAMAAGVSQFAPVQEIAHKLNVQKEFEAYVKEWAAESKANRPPETGFDMSFIDIGKKR